MRESTTSSKGYEGYGYFWWLSGKGVFRASGIFGQGIYVDRNEKLVIALHSARPAASEETIFVPNYLEGKEAQHQGMIAFLNSCACGPSDSNIEVLDFMKGDGVVTVRLAVAVFADYTQWVRFY